MLSASLIRSHIPKLRVYDVCGFDFSDDVLATMLCFHLDRHDSISNIKSIAFSSSDVQTLVEKEDRRASSVDLENFIRKRNFEVNQRILAENIKHSLHWIVQKFLLLMENLNRLKKKGPIIIPILHHCLNG